jgi:3-oxoacyl-[acyl-carrier protein] reductase
MTAPLLENKVAVVTGGGGGLGRAMAARFAQEGARIVLADIDLAAAETAAAQLPGGALCLRADMGSPDEVAELVRRAGDELGAIHVFVNNAGITRDATIKNMTLDDWDAVMSVHLRGAFLGTKFVAERMREQGSGTIVNISSLSGKVGNFGQANYSSAKAGLVGLTKVAAKELSRFGVRVNAIQPGLIRTAMTEALSQKVWDAKLAEIPLGRAGEPDEVAKVALFLASDLSSYMTGAVLEVGGGRYM